MIRNRRNVVGSVIKPSGLMILLILLLALSVLPPISAAAAEEPKRILLLFAEDQSFPLISTLGQSIRSTLTSRSAGRNEFYTEHLDRTRIADDVYETELVNFWQKKYEGRKIDLIIVCVASAVDLLSRHRAELFPEAPAVLCLIFEQQFSRANIGRGVTAVWSAPPFQPTLELALRLNPDTRRVIVVTGSNDFDRSVRELAKAELSDFESRVELHYLPEITIGELQERLASLPKATIVLYLSFSKDSDGVVLTGPEVVSRVAPSSSAPIYGVATPYFGSGIVGGSLLTIENLGVRAAEIGARILAGERPQDIPPQSVPNVLMFDWREMRRWGINEKNLPPGSIVRFAVPSFWEEYKWRIVGVVSLVIVQSLLIVGLVINRIRRKQADKAMSESEARFRVMADTAPVLIWLSGPDKLCTYFNSQWLEFTGRTMEQELDCGWAERVHPEDYEDWLAIYVSAFDSRQSFRMEYRLRHHDGEYRVVMDSGVPRFLSDGVFAGYIGSAIDITDRKRAEEALHQTQAELAHVARVLTTGELAATIAHEVNQPLTAMVANANAARRWLSNGKANLDEVREAIDDIVLDAHRASEVVGRIRALLKQGTRRHGPLRINEVIHEVVAIVTNDLVRKRVSLRLDLAADLPDVESDRIELQQVLLNLILNGMEAMLGEVDSPRNLLIRTVKEDSSRVMVEVRDSGTGIAEDKLGRIFDAFYTTKAEGMGMGLSICRTIVETHGGRLWAESNKDEGATFRFTLPIATPVETSAVQTRSPQG